VLPPFRALAPAKLRQMFAGQEGLRDHPADAQIGFLGSGTKAAQAE
jgi:hypothetical protein